MLPDHLIQFLFGIGSRAAVHRPAVAHLTAEVDILQGFKQFMLRGNVLDLAVAVVMGAAFGAVVTALVKDLITPLIAAIGGKPDFLAIQFTVHGSRFAIGDFINAMVSFILIGVAVYFSLYYR
jgi:large conductance mechanosensitive channel protein